MNQAPQIKFLKCTIYIVRHGQSEGNVVQMILPPNEDTLTEAGNIQADLLGKHLQEIEFTKAYSSPYSRAYDTGKVIQKNSNITNKPALKVDERLRERESGDLTGKSMKEAWKQLLIGGQHASPTLEFDVPGGETADEFDGRIGSFLYDLFVELKRSEKPEKVLIVSHSFTIVRMMCKLNDENKKDTFSKSGYLGEVCKPLKNTNYHVITIKIQPPKSSMFERITVDFFKLHQNDHLENLEEEGNSSLEVFTSHMNDC